jgi:DNA-binding NarL/FixJ family response regulator
MPAAPAKPKVVLVLGDPGFATAMAKYLSQRGFDPTLVKQPSSTVDVIKEISPAAVLLSQLLSGLDGPALTRKIRDAQLTVPIIMIAAVSSQSGVTDVTRVSSADLVLPANFLPEGLVAILRRAVAGESLDARKDAPLTRKGPGKDDTAAIRVANATAGKAASDALGGVRRTLELEIEINSTKPIGGDPKPIPPAPETVATSTTPPVAIDPAYLLSRAFNDNVTGSLRFVSGGAERTIYLNAGRPIVATSNLPEERIGQILIRKGKITKGELDGALIQVKKKQKRLAQIMVEMGVMTVREHDEELAEQYAERILALFAWRQASIEFTPMPPPHELVQILLPPERLVVEGLRRHYEPERLAAALVDPNRVLRLSADAGRRVPFLVLQPLEAATLVLIDGQRTVREICSQSPGRVEALRALYASLCLGIAG